MECARRLIMLLRLPVRGGAKRYIEREIAARRVLSGDLVAPEREKKQFIIGSDFFCAVLQEPSVVSFLYSDLLLLHRDMNSSIQWADSS